jgi:hypothetical protein
LVRARKVAHQIGAADRLSKVPIPVIRGFLMIGMDVAILFV